jgi:glycosyltransferase involved in cell wall biosynthesis
MTPWIVCQLCPREHYAIPRALKRAGIPTKLVTEYWSQGMLAPFFGKRLAQRRHDELVGKDVTSFNLRYLLFESWARIQRLRSWDRYLAIGDWFGKNVVQRLPELIQSFSDRPAVFAYSYSASEIFPTAKKLGCKTILGQIDPGIEEERILVELHRRAGLEPFPAAPRDYWDRWRRECDLSDIIMVNSNWSYECLLKEGIDDSKIRIVELAYERGQPATSVHRSFVEKFTKSRPLRILFLGQVNVRKGILEIADAIELLRNEPVEWTIVGGGSLDETRLFKAGSPIRRVQQVSRREVENYYSQADVFILPTHSDGYAITLLEAASWGLPIISSRHCGQVVQHLENGLILDTVTSETICKAVRQLLTSPSELARMSELQSRRKARTIENLSGELALLFQ